jgi:hypothetical protein
VLQSIAAGPQPHHPPTHPRPHPPLCSCHERLTNFQVKVLATAPQRGMPVGGVLCTAYTGGPQVSAAKTLQQASRGSAAQPAMLAALAPPAHAG